MREVDLQYIENTTQTILVISQTENIPANKQTILV